VVDYVSLEAIELLPGLAALPLAAKAARLQQMLERAWFAPNGLCYSLVLITGPEHLRPMGPADTHGISDHSVEGVYDDGGATSEAARDEGMTFENSIYSAGLYLQAQAARLAATGEPDALREAGRALTALRLIYDDGVARGRAGWLGKPYGQVPKDHSTPDQYHAAMLGLYHYRPFADASERQIIDRMVCDIADFLQQRDYQIWNLQHPIDSKPWNLTNSYCNATYVLAQALAWHVSGADRHRTEALRLATLSQWRTQSYLGDWHDAGRARVLEFERVCLAAFVIEAADVLAHILPEVFGASADDQAHALRHTLEVWWEFAQLGMDDAGRQHYWIDIDVERRTWQPTGVRRNDTPPFPGEFFGWYSDVRWSDSLYRTLTAALPVIARLPERRAAALAWAQRIMHATDGRRLRWMIDLDGQQLRPMVRWMGCMLSSEAPCHFLMTWWRGRAAGLWPAE